MKGDGVKATFNLSGATFSHGPVQTWPNWPNPPIVEVMAIQVQLRNGDWLALAPSFSPRTGLFYLIAWEDYHTTYFQWDQSYEPGKSCTGGAARAPFQSLRRDPFIKWGPNGVMAWFGR